jgi:protein-L-isoaspartate O-methyltransferase
LILTREAPFKVIHVGAAAPEIPEALVEQVSYLHNHIALIG